jgi:hypothetical protein
MNEEYLWNRAGEPDEEIARLEALLAPLRYRPGAKRKPRRVWWLAAAAALIAGLVSAPLLTRGPLTTWRAASGQHLRVGQWVGAASIESVKTGEIRLDPGARLRLVAESAGREHFQLERGTIHAFIWAPPGRFVVDTPSAKTTDLGCRYTLNVSDNGTGLLTVQIGWVAFESHGVESFIPEGAACATRPKLGPGTPYFTDAPTALLAGLERFDSTGDSAELESVLANARPRDALTLWHLLARTQGERRGEVFDRFAALVSLPDGMTRQAVLSGDASAFDAAWNALKLGDTSWWRKWKQSE